MVIILLIISLTPLAVSLIDVPSHVKIYYRLDRRARVIILWLKIKAHPVLSLARKKKKKKKRILVLCTIDEP
jgi:hypothetical protein